ncbi:MAG: DUF1365 domain-containing protein [Hyphomicrobiaceae bacterium]
MSDRLGWIYTGDVVHARVRPKRHHLRYSVFTLALDLDKLTELSRSVRGLAYNRFGLLAIHDRDHGTGEGPIADHVRGLLGEAGLAAFGSRIIMVCYPRVVGYVFNPLTVFYGYDSSGQLGALAYEVNNTFGERKTYVVASGPATDAGIYRQSCAKEMSVSPFTPGSGRYGFHLTEPGAYLTIGVHYRDEHGPVLRTHFSGRQVPLTSETIRRHVLRWPLLTQRVIGAIHFEALRLFLKGVPLIRRHRSPAFSAAYRNHPPTGSNSTHA